MIMAPLSFFQRVEQLTSHCEDSINLLQSTISSLESTVLPPTAEVTVLAEKCYFTCLGLFASNSFFVVVDF